MRTAAFCEQPVIRETGCHSVVQEQIREMGRCLSDTGPDMASAAGIRVRGLLEEYCLSNFAKARADPAGHQALWGLCSFYHDPLQIAVCV